MSTGALISYSPLPRGYRWRRVLRITLAVLVGAVLFLGFEYWSYSWPSIKAERARKYWEKQCLNHRSPAGTISYSNDPQDVQRLKASGCFTSGPNWPCKPYAMRQIPEFEKLFNRSVAPALFVHGRNAPSGPQRLVIVQMGTLPNDPFNRITLAPVNHQPLGTRGTTPSSPIGQLEICLKWEDSIRLYEGQPDASDATHFTIDYDLNGVRGTIDGKLTASGAITLNPRNGRVALLGATSFWSPGGAPFPPAVEKQLAGLPTTRPSR
jgi:hypothetical protein